MAEGNSTFVLTAGVTAPSQFSFVAKDWPRWAQRWERYWVASGLKKQSDEEQLNMLVYVMGEKAEDVLLSLQLSAADKKKYKKVCEEFNNHYMGRVNIVYMRAKFNQRCQEEGEAVDEFISDLYRLIQYCEYGSLQDDLLRDRIVVGVYDAKLSQALQMDPGLTLEVALRKARQAEEVQRQQGLLRGTQGSTHRGVASDYEVSEVKKRTKPISGKRASPGGCSGQSQHQRCGRCGRSPQHAFATCLARQSTCHACSKKGHWRKMCRLRKSVGTVVVREEDDEEDIYYLGIVDTNVEPWWVTVTLNGVDIEFKIDTGADVTVIGSLVVEDKLQGIKLTPTSKRLAGIGGTNFCAKGSFEAKLQWKEKLCDETIYVTPGGREVLLGRPAIQKLGILKWVGVTSLRNGAPEKTFPALFNGLGKKDEAMVKEVIKALPMSDTRLEEVREKQERDDVLKEIKQYVRNGWPAHKEDLELPLRRYYEERGYLNEGEGLLMHGHRVVIPKELRKEMLDRLHKGHLGIGKCRERARDAIWWPGISADIQNAVEKCEECPERCPQPVEPLMPTAVPERPWMMVGMDIVTVRNQSFLVVVDYFSRYPEVARLTSTTAAAVIGKIKAIFARFGIPEVVRSDNGPQFRGEMLEFAKEYGFRLITSSPLLARSNGQAESAVKIVKNILLKEKDPNLGLLVYRSTPLETGYSPAELLMGRKLRTNLPISSYSLQPSWPNLREHREKMGIKKAKAAEKYNRRHRAQPLPELKPRDQVWVTDRKHYGKIANRRNEPRSYDVEVDGGVVRRNRAFLVAAKSVAQSSGSGAGEFHRGEIMTRSGRVVRKPICMCER
ncbi:uncharacterized protein LOC124160378 [Ischnura elegans]|uniref:uncharacterized protein LOC124160378 n=1 Tax=Ischnura elegans TaxID=197161 RepID=UPI001ED8BBB3|nr:uncharacterized protein LOC124160378 [Ischnura elegans]